MLYEEAMHSFSYLYGALDTINNNTNKILLRNQKIKLQVPNIPTPAVISTTGNTSSDCLLTLIELYKELKRVPVISYIHPTVILVGMCVYTYV